MKWLILSDSAESCKTVKEFLASKNCQVSVAELNSDYGSIVNEIKNANNYLICDSEILAKNPVFLFFYGLMAEKGQYVFVAGNNAEELKFLSGSGKKFFYCTKAADVLDNIKDNFNEYFAEDKKAAALKELLSRGLPLSADCMVHSIERDKSEIVELVYDAGLDINSWTEDGVPVLCAAARCDKIEYVVWLLDHNADVNIISKDRGYSPVMDAVWKKNLDMVNLFIKAGADLSIMSTDGQPILVLAVGNGNVKIVEALLKAGADPDVKDSMGMSARSYASLFKNEDLIKLMNQYPKKEQN
ncbi:MAG: ankyrin repeat domain-containing protein [Treponema sp.]|nr:ankyrin repeat domain-containing protein [Spirochaetia bacterium]MDD7459380.1 ankyrin repeat domain-containing protein [Spirochaetales bacterium]MDY5810370.1 ankyrin repeat domain-containing protein [Treponema sp.]MEE1182096.1 ankyrin repeat domain-containing protein [Treponema sp.]